MFFEHVKGKNILGGKILPLAEGTKEHFFGGRVLFLCDFFLQFGNLLFLLFQLNLQRLDVVEGGFEVALH